MFDSLFQNKYSQAVIVFLAVVGLVSIIQNAPYFFGQSVYAPTVADEQAPHVHDSSHAHNEGKMHEMMEDHMGDMMEDRTQNTVEEMPMIREESEVMDYTGTHIMPNGEVMTGAGVVIPEAVILENGDIEIPDGTVLTPAMDMR